MLRKDAHAFAVEKCRLTRRKSGAEYRVAIFFVLYGRSWTEESLQKIETFSPDNASNVVERDKLVYRTRIETGS